MINYKNIKLSFLDNEDIAQKIKRQGKFTEIISLVYTSAPYLHKRIRYRFSSLLCEYIFGYRFVCREPKCRVLEYNENRIKNTACYYCGNIMRFNKYRENRFGAIFLNFPICNPLRLQKILDCFILFKNFNMFKKDNLYYRTYEDEHDDIKFKELYMGNSDAIFNVFSSFINIINIFCSSINIFNKNKYRKKACIKVFLENQNVIKNIKENTFINSFLILMPVLPINLRENIAIVKGKPVGSKFNFLYRFIIEVNNKLLKTVCSFNYKVKYIGLLFFLIKIIATYALLLDIYPDPYNIYERLQGKYGIFRQKLLGFRVDYSGRTVIVPEPELPISKVGIPVNMLQQIYNPEPYVDITKLTKHKGRFFKKIRKYKKPTGEIKSNRYMSFSESCGYACSFIGSIIENTVIVNRAPTLHKMNTQSFNPIFVEGRSIKFMPMLCSGYNADFDGDQMGVFSILFKSSILESQSMTRSFSNMRSPTNKKNMFNTTQGILLGNYGLTIYNCLPVCSYIVINNYTTLTEIGAISSYTNILATLRYFKYFYKTNIGRSILTLKNSLNIYSTKK
ncbi:DNA-directed RNA polymerase (apicoplast) [Babesia ovis]|uniref:DNA-directed RNA polymerase n=1 Tax=Babesia ovis TaxID=5869 RepID=A0A9W5TEP3_BABOV|nr:DNA-directed RNA polymerase [Babesia ovis]